MNNINNDNSSTDTNITEIEDKDDIENRNEIEDKDDIENRNEID